MGEPPNDPELKKIWDRIGSLETRIVRYDERFEWMEKCLTRLEKQVMRLDSRLWWLLGTVILGILITIATKLL